MRSSSAVPGALTRAISRLRTGRMPYFRGVPRHDLGLRGTLPVAQTAADRPEPGASASLALESGARPGRLPTAWPVAELLGRAPQRLRPRELGGPAAGSASSWKCGFTAENEVRFGARASACRGRRRCTVKSSEQGRTLVITAILGERLVLEIPRESHSKDVSSGGRGRGRRQGTPLQSPRPPLSPWAPAAGVSLGCHLAVRGPELAFTPHERGGRPSTTG